MMKPETVQDQPRDDEGDLRVLEAQADALRREGRHAAADQLLAWRDLHALRVARDAKQTNNG